MMKTLNSACAELGVPHQNARWHMQRGRIIAQHTGTVYLVDPELLQKELVEAGFYKRRALLRRNKKRARAAAQNQEK